MPGLATLATRPDASRIFMSTFPSRTPRSKSEFGGSSLWPGGLQANARDAQKMISASRCTLYCRLFFKCEVDHSPVNICFLYANLYFIAEPVDPLAPPANHTIVLFI